MHERGNSMNIDMKQTYNDNLEFQDYVKGYCKTYGYEVDEALTHITVKEVAKYYISKGKSDG